MGTFKMVREDKTTWKSNYFAKLTTLLDEYPKCFIVGADNVGSKQMQEIRIALRGQAVVLMGKNTMMRKAIRGHLETNPDLERLMPHIKQNVGFVFTKMELLHVRDLLLSNKVKAPAKAGALAPVDVVVPAQNTGMGPEKTSFFQALAIPTKITKGTIEIIKDVDIIKAGDRVGMSEATLLNMLKISPFSYGLVISKVYDSGSVFDRDPGHHRRRPACQVRLWGGQRCCYVPGHKLSQRGISPAQHRQRHEEPAGHCCGHRDHLQGG